MELASLSAQTLHHHTACQTLKSGDAARQENTASWCPAPGFAEITRGDVSAVMNRLTANLVTANVLQKVGDSIQ